MISEKPNRVVKKRGSIQYRPVLCKRFLLWEVGAATHWESQERTGEQAPWDDSIAWDCQAAAFTYKLPIGHWVASGDINSLAIPS